MGKKLSLNPDDQVKGGGNFDDIDIEVVDAGVVLFGYPNKEGQDTVVPPAPAVMVGYKGEAEPGVEPVTFTDHLSAGDRKKVKPSDDGSSLELIDEDADTRGLTDNTNFGFYLKELQRAGYPVERMTTTDVKKILIGLKGHYRRVDPPKGSLGKKPIGVITKVNSLPGEGVPGKAAGGGAAGGAEVLAVDFIGKVLTKTKGEPVEKVKLGQAANKFFDGKAEKVEVVKLVLDDKFLKKGPELNPGWAYNGRQVSGKADLLVAAVAKEVEL